MKKTILLSAAILLLTSCKEEKLKESKDQQIEISIPLDTTKKDSTKDSVLAKNDIENQKKEVNHLFIANGGSILYMKNGDIKGQARFDTDGDFVGELLKTKTYGKYTDYDNYIIEQNGDTTTFFDENGRIGNDWVIVKGISIKNNLQVASFVSPKQQKMNETEDIQTTKLIIFKPEMKSFKDENSVEAENYFIAMHDWNFYSYKLKEYFEKLKVGVRFTEKRYLSFEIENKEKIILDTKSKINNYKAQCLLYKKGKRPIIVYLVLTEDMQYDIQNYLKY